FAMLERVMTPETAVALAVLAGVLVAIWMRIESEECSADAFAWPMAASLLCAPVVYPRYLLWLLPFFTSASIIPLVVLTVSIFPTYTVWHLRAVGRPWILPGWIELLEYGTVAVAAAILMLLRTVLPRKGYASGKPSR